MTSAGLKTIEGRIVEVRNGVRKISRSFTYGYMSLRVLVGFEYYSVLVSTSKLNKYGFIPKVGQWIRAEGRLSNSQDDFYDASLSHITSLEHIEPPKN
ncbi:unnamed protein product [marine sediment metagenome]|uniref:Uncharacterized protein n=1 Tax=marine sediment metagenome TaxID=412755 RepID=X0ZU27_9ZZZZ